MEVEKFPSEDSRVWLSAEEILKLCDFYEVGSQKWTAINILSRVGLKLTELITLKRENVYIDEPHSAIKISGSGMRPSLRKCPIPESVAYTIMAYEEGEVINRTARTVRRWVKHAASELASETSNDNWEKVIPLDLRRSWADILLDEGIPPAVLMEWGGWEDSKAFQRTYLSRHNTTSSLGEASQSTLY